MAYNEMISNRIREALQYLPDVVEKEMFGGVTYLVNGKMCVGVVKDEMMCRIGEEQEEQALQKPGCREMDFGRRNIKGYVYVCDEGMRSPKEFAYWIDLCLAYNPKAKATKKKK